jgi:hypothetical protein
MTLLLTPWPRTSDTVKPSTPTCISADFTLSNLLGWTIASIYIIVASFSSSRDQSRLQLIAIR